MNYLFNDLFLGIIATNFLRLYHKEITLLIHSLLIRTKL